MHIFSFRNPQSSQFLEHVGLGANTWICQGAASVRASLLRRFYCARMIPLGVFPASEQMRSDRVRRSTRQLTLGDSLRSPVGVPVSQILARRGYWTTFAAAGLQFVAGHDTLRWSSTAARAYASAPCLINSTIHKQPAQPGTKLYTYTNQRHRFPSILGRLALGPEVTTHNVTMNDGPRSR